MSVQNVCRHCQQPLLYRVPAGQDLCRNCGRYRVAGQQGQPLQLDQRGWMVSQRPQTTIDRYQHQQRRESSGNLYKVDVYRGT